MYQIVNSWIPGQAHVCVKRNRVKNYNGKVYLQDKQEFEIELYNPSDKLRIAEIFVNGKLISTSAIVVRPGQRIYLERFIDVPKKLVFNTYTVDENPETSFATANNGVIQVKFYDEIEQETPVTVSFNNYTGAGAFYNSKPLYRSSTSGIYSGSFTTNSVNLASLSNSATNVTYETGRIEKGSDSKQEFTQFQGNFKHTPTNTVYIKIKPLSTIEAKLLAVYCRECGTKNKKGVYKFCPKCGTKF